jgi:AcrR family transcriptional regulator
MASPVTRGDDKDPATEPSARERVVSQLVSAAMTLFAERGPDRVSLREVAAAAGVNYGLIHQYVGSKEDLLSLVFRRASADWAEQFANAPTLTDALAWQFRPQSATYVRMLTHSLLDGHDPAKLLGRSPALQEMSRRLSAEADLHHGPGGLSDDARVQAAALTCVRLGWGLFGDFLRTIAGLDDLPEDEVTLAVYSTVRQIVVPRAAEDR